MLVPAISPTLFLFPPKIDRGPLPNKSLPTIKAPMAKATKPTTNFVIFVLSVPINAIFQSLFKKLVYADFLPVRFTGKRSANLNGYRHSPKGSVNYKPLAGQVIRELMLTASTTFVPNHFHCINSFLVRFLNAESKGQNRDGVTLFRKVFGVSQNKARQCFIFARSKI